MIMISNDLIKTSHLFALDYNKVHPRKNPLAEVHPLFNPYITQLPWGPEKQKNEIVNIFKTTSDIE